MPAETMSTGITSSTDSFSAGKPPGPFIDRLERQWYPPESQLLDFVWLDPGRIDWEYSTNGRFAPSDDGEDWAGFGPARHDYGKLTEEFSGEAGGDQ